MESATIARLRSPTLSSITNSLFEIGKLISARNNDMHMQVNGGVNRGQGCRKSMASGGEAKFWWSDHFPSTRFAPTKTCHGSDWKALNERQQPSLISSSLRSFRECLIPLSWFDCGMCECQVQESPGESFSCQFELRMIRSITKYAQQCGASRPPVSLARLLYN
jgi:hypothetical protein